MHKYILTIIIIFSYSIIKAQQPLKSTQFFNYIDETEIKIQCYKTIYTVPKDSSLIITDISMSGFYSTTALLRNKKRAITLDNKTWFHTCTGLIFMAGDELSFYNENEYVSINVYWNIIGYLKKQD